MREIKFRGKTAKDGRWLYGDYVMGRGVDYILPHGTAPRTATAADFAVNPDTVGQYVGERDRNGREIYEGDIIDGSDSPGTVMFAHGKFFIRWQCTDGHGDIEPTPFSPDAVIGNIHDNPEILDL